MLRLAIENKKTAGICIYIVVPVDVAIIVHITRTGAVRSPRRAPPAGIPINMDVVVVDTATRITIIHNVDEVDVRRERKNLYTRRYTGNN